MKQQSLNKHIYNPEVAARKILGKNYWSVAKFFLQIFSYCAALRQSGKRVVCAFMTQRCHVLSLVFGDIFSYYRTLPAAIQPRNLNIRELQSLADLDENCLITDFNLVCKGGEIAKYYLKTGEFPSIVLVDDILIHGRAVNRVLLELEREVLLGVDKAEANENVHSEFLKALKIQVFAQKNGPLLLIRRFQSCLKSKENWMVEQLREYSRQFTLLVSSSNHNNAAYSWILRLPSEGEKNTVYTSQFCRVITDLGDIRQTNFFWYYPTPQRAKAVCAIHWRENQVGEVEGQLLAVPFILFGYTPVSRLWRLHQQIVKDLEKLDLHFLRESDVLRENSETCLRWISETNNLVLCSLLSRKFWGDEMANCQPDWTAVARNHIRFSETGKNGSICQELKRLWDWANNAPDVLLNKYLCLLLDDSAPMWEFPEMNEQDCHVIALPETTTKGLTKAIDDTIASISYASERNTYEKYTANISLSEQAVSARGKPYSIGEILHRSFALWGGRIGISELSYSLGLILQEMDLFLIDMHSCIANDQFCTMLQTREQALFIKPIRYQKYIPTLSMIKRRCGNGRRDLCDEIERFVSVLPHLEADLAKELYAFVQDLDWVHHKLDEWDVPGPVKLERKIDKTGTVTLTVSYDRDDVFHEQVTYLMTYTAI